VNDFDFDYDYAPANQDNPASASASKPAANPEPDAPATPVAGAARRVRAVITNGAGQFLAQVNHRVTLGANTIMLPGGEVEADEGELTALARHIRDELGITMQLDASNTRFLLNRTYEFPVQGGESTTARINFYQVISDGAVPRNMVDSVLSVGWMTPADVRRYIEADQGGWKIMLGALDAIDFALDPSKAKITDGARELARQDGGKAPDGGEASKPSRLPYGPVTESVSIEELETQKEKNERDFKTRYDMLLKMAERNPAMRDTAEKAKAFHDEQQRHIDEMIADRKKKA
jgi:ADP-ribose pyrophosphatase YjhB (NUDIX family)